jgi:hypothetical protein
MTHHLYLVIHMKKTKKTVKDVVSSVVTAAGGSLAGGIAAGEAAEKTLGKIPSPKPKKFGGEEAVERDKESVKEGRKLLKKMQDTFKKD